MVQLQSILGHSTLDMTKKYVHLYGKDIQRDFDRLNPLEQHYGEQEIETTFNSVQLFNNYDCTTQTLHPLLNAGFVCAL